MDNNFEKLVEKARLETPPDIDVADQVMRIIESDRIKVVNTYDKPFIWMAGLSTAAAVTIAGIAIYGYFAWTNPLVEMSETISWVM